ncbi:MAG: hypothetical protein RL417_2326, partial [Pseudomonadota bacterium]
MPPIFLGLICAVCGGFLAIVNRALMRRGADVWAVSGVALVVGGLVILPFVDLEAIFVARFDVVSIAALIGANVAWAAMTVYDARAYAGLSASVNALLNALRLVLLVLAGRFLFGESIPPLGIIGSILIVIGILAGASLSELSQLRAARDRALAVLWGGVAITLDKYLTGVLPVDFVLLAGFFLPALFLLIVKGDIGRRIAREMRSAAFLLVLGGVLTGAMGWTLMYGFARGELWSTLALRHMDIVFTFIFALILLKERERGWQRGCAAVLCSVGAVCVTLSKDISSGAMRGAGESENRALLASP